MALDTVFLLRTLVEHSSMSLTVWSEVDVEGFFHEMNFNIVVTMHGLFPLYVRCPSAFCYEQLFKLYNAALSIQSSTLVDCSIVSVLYSLLHGLCDLKKATVATIAKMIAVKLLMVKIEPETYLPIPGYYW